MADRPEKGALLAGKGKSVLGLVLGAALTVFCALYAVPRYGNTGAVLTALALAVTGYNAYFVFGGKHTPPEVRQQAEEENEQAREEARAQIMALEEQYNSVPTFFANPPRFFSRAGGDFVRR